MSDESTRTICVEFPEVSEIKSVLIAFRFDNFNNKLGPAYQALSTVAEWKLDKLKFFDYEETIPDVDGFHKSRWVLEFKLIDNEGEKQKYLDEINDIINYLVTNGRFEHKSTRFYDEDENLIGAVFYEEDE